MQFAVHNSFTQETFHKTCVYTTKPLPKRLHICFWHCITVFEHKKAIRHQTFYNIIRRMLFSDANAFFDTHTHTHAHSGMYTAKKIPCTFNTKSARSTAFTQLVLAQGSIYAAKVSRNLLFRNAFFEISSWVLSLENKTFTQQLPKSLSPRIPCIPFAVWKHGIPFLCPYFFNGLGHTWYERELYLSAFVPVPSWRCLREALWFGGGNSHNWNALPPSLSSVFFFMTSTCFADARTTTFVSAHGFGTPAPQVLSLKLFCLLLLRFLRQPTFWIVLKVIKGGGAEGSWGEPTEGSPWWLPWSRASLRCGAQENGQRHGHSWPSRRWSITVRDSPM